MSSPKIVVRLAGGLGNQLFQFVAAVRLAQCQGLPSSNICIDTRFLDSYEAVHKYEIGFVSDLFFGVQVGLQIPVMASLASRFRLAKLFDKKLGSFELISSAAHLNAACASHSTAYAFILDGYFQHTDVLFAEEDRSLIRTALLSSNRFLIDQVITGLPSIGVHIRRGDYVTSKSAAKVFRSIPVEYYDMALQQLRRDHQVLVFSDDRDLSKVYAAKVNGIDVRQLKISLEQEFCLLMACNNHIIANSTFSWWAAYLGHIPGGRVIAPKNWYRDKHRSQSNPLLFPYFELIDA